jgi:hypothetical protein
MAFLKRRLSVPKKPKQHLNSILVTGIWHVGVLTVFLFSLSFLTREIPQIDPSAPTNTNNGQTRAVPPPQEGEENG